MRFFLYMILIAIEYVLGKIVWLLLQSMVFNGLAPVIGVIVAALFVGVMVATWRFGVQQINS